MQVLGKELGMEDRPEVGVEVFVGVDVANESPRVSRRLD